MKRYIVVCDGIETRHSTLHRANKYRENVIYLLGGNPKIYKETITRVRIK